MAVPYSESCGKVDKQSKKMNEEYGTEIPG